MTRKFFGVVALILFLAAGAVSQDMPKDQAQVWALERSYWEYVKVLDIDKYRALWHENFVGWPRMSPAPVRKAHITDWITDYTSQGMSLQSFALEPLDIQVTRDVVVTHYRIKMVWAHQQGGAETQASRITHTWLRTGGTWQIVGGMSAPVNAEGK